MDRKTKNYYVLLKERNRAILKRVKGEDDIDVQGIDFRILDLTKPENMFGSDGLEVRYSNSFETAKSVISKVLNRTTDGLTAYQFELALKDAMAQNEAKK